MNVCVTSLPVVETRRSSTDRAGSACTGAELPTGIATTSVLAVRSSRNALAPIANGAEPARKPR